MYNICNNAQKRRFLYVHIADNTFMKKQLILYMLLAAFVFGITSPALAADYVTVKKGDTMWKIAQRYNVSFAEVLRLNRAHHINVDLIHPGDKIYLPTGSTGTGTTQNSKDDDIKTGDSKATENGSSQEAVAILHLVNTERQKHGLPSLKLSNGLTSVANVKARDMAVNNYFDHNSPTYGTPFQMMQQFGIHYMSAGENIAAGQRTAQEVMTAWLNSSGHRANILNAKFDTLGVGYYKGGSYGYYWVQQFIGN